MVWLNTPTKLWLTRYTTKPRQPAKQNKLKSIEFQPTNNTKEMKELTHSPKGAQKQTEEETYSKTPHKNLETKIYKYFKLSNLNCYQNSTISCEAKILSDEILKFYKSSTKKLARSIAVINTWTNKNFNYDTIKPQFSKLSPRKNRSLLWSILWLLHWIPKRKQCLLTNQLSRNCITYTT